MPFWPFPRNTSAAMVTPLEGAMGTSIPSPGKFLTVTCSNVLAPPPPLNTTPSVVPVFPVPSIVIGVAAMPPCVAQSMVTAWVMAGRGELWTMILADPVAGI